MASGGGDQQSGPKPEPTPKPKPQLTVSTGPDGRTLVVQGELDMATSPELVRQVLEAVESQEWPRPTVRLDLSGVTFADASGMRGLFAISQMLTTGELFLVSPHRRVRRVLDLMYPEGTSWFRYVTHDEDLLLEERG